ncbi:MAG: ABC transporter substrate-binding protein [Nitrospirae bacterium]|nr:ABC transporter substrate-binding protein [Nitrospirota bacterium]
MIKSKLSLALLALIAVFSLAWLPLRADAGEPTNQVKETVDAVMNILNDKELRKPEKQKERRTLIRQTIIKRFDFEEMAKRSLAAHWKDRTPAEQKEFVALYSDLLENTYIRKIERYENEKVVYYDEKLDGDYAVVKTKIIKKEGISIPVEYRILRKKDKWEVYDIIIEGISLVNNYRTQFTQIIRSGSYNDLVKRLREKVIK